MTKLCSLRVPNSLTPSPSSAAKLSSLVSPKLQAELTTLIARFSTITRIAARLPAQCVMKGNLLLKSQTLVVPSTSRRFSNAQKMPSDTVSRCFSQSSALASMARDVPPRLSIRPTLSIRVSRLGPTGNISRSETSRRLVELKRECSILMALPKTSSCGQSLGPMRMLSRESPRICSSSRRTQVSRQASTLTRGLARLRRSTGMRSCSIPMGTRWSSPTRRMK